jgi:3-oxoacyl-[acyl-carrier protein] reductase
MCPGLVETEMAHVLSPEAHKNIIGQTPMGRIGQPEEIAAVIRFLLSDESSFMTGQTIVASGGRVMLPGEQASDHRLPGRHFQAVGLGLSPSGSR